MLKITFISCLIFFLNACSSLMHFQEQPVQAMAENTYQTTCNGVAEGWDSCFRKAQRTCPSGYKVLDKL